MEVDSRDDRSLKVTRLEGKEIKKNQERVINIKSKQLT